MRKFAKNLVVGVILTCTMAIMAGCGAKKETATFTNELYDMKTEMVLDAEDGDVKKIKMSVIMPGDAVDESQIEEMEEEYKELEGTGVKVSIDKKDKDYSLNIDITLDDASLETLEELGLDFEDTSLKTARKDLLDEGWTEE